MHGVAAACQMPETACSAGAPTDWKSTRGRVCFMGQASENEMTSLTPLWAS